MTLQHASAATIFTATFPNGKKKKFSLGEYLAWRESADMPIGEKDFVDWTNWFNAEDNNFGRIGAWISIREWRLENPDNTATRLALPYL